MDYSELTKEQAIENIRSVIDAFQGTKQQHALLDASLAMLAPEPSPDPSSNGSEPAAVPS